MSSAAGAEADVPLNFVSYKYNDPGHMEGYIADTKWPKDAPLPPVGTEIDTDGGRGTITRIDPPTRVFPHYMAYVTIEVIADAVAGGGGETSLHLGKAPHGSNRPHILLVDGVPGTNHTMTDGDWPNHLGFPPVGSEVKTKWGSALMTRIVQDLGGTKGFATISPDGWGTPSRSMFTSR